MKKAISTWSRVTTYKTNVKTDEEKKKTLDANSYVLVFTSSFPFIAVFTLTYLMSVSNNKSSLICV